MHCSTCGATIPPGRNECTTCGARPSSPHPSASARPETPLAPFRFDGTPVGLCPRCAFTGGGLGYFSRGTNVAKLVGLTAVTGGAMGVGGLVYFFMRRDHRVCPRCGKSWGPRGERALAPAGALQRGEERLPVALADDGGGLNRGAAFLFLVAAFFLGIGLIELEAVLLLFGLLAGGAGAFSLHRSRQARLQRREALLARLQPPVLRLAGEREGRLTVSETAASLGWTLPRAEKVLASLDDGLRVNSVVTDEGVIVYEFLEIAFGPAPKTRGIAAGASPAGETPAAPDAAEREGEPAGRERPSA